MRVEVALSPLLYPCRTIGSGHTTVVVDVLRATTAICAAFGAGCSEVVALDDLSQLPQYRRKGYLVAAERGGRKVNLPAGEDEKEREADYGNSPTEYAKSNLRGCRLAYSTTNGTRSIVLARGSDRGYVGAFANLTALSERLKKEGEDVVVMCSGWAGDACLEDTLFAGALIERLLPECQPTGDGAMMALALWREAKGDLRAYCDKATHVQRLIGLGAGEDVDYALRIDTCDVVPAFRENVIAI